MINKNKFETTLEKSTNILAKSIAIMMYWDGIGTGEIDK